MHKRIHRRTFNTLDIILSWVTTFILLFAIIVTIVFYTVIGLTSKVNYISNLVPIQYSGYGITHISNIDNNNITYEKLKLLIPKETDIILYSGGFVDSENQYNNTIEILNKLSKDYRVLYVLQEKDIEFKTDIVNNTLCEYIDEKVIELNVDSISADKFIEEHCDKIVSKHIEKGLNDSKLYKEFVEYKINQDKTRKIIITGLDGNESNDYDTKSKILNTVDTYDKNITKILLLGNINKVDILKDVNIDITFVETDKENKVLSNSYNKSTLIVSKGLENKWYKSINYRLQFIEINSNVGINKTLLERLFDFINNNNSYKDIPEVIEYKGGL